MRIIFKFFLLFVLFFVWSNNLSAEWVKVDHVIDGDTIITDSGEKVRFLGVNTPEIKSNYNDFADYLGEEAKEFVVARILNRRVRLENDGRAYDKYGRRLAYIFTEDGVSLEKELIQIGLAEAIHRFNYNKKDEFIALEQEARKKNIGIWECE